MVALLDCCQDHGVTKLVFSSSAATYGLPDVDLVDEDTPCLPLSPYGETKLIGEWLIRTAPQRGGWAPSLAAGYSDQLGVPVTTGEGRQRSYAAICEQVLSTRHGDLLSTRAQWATVEADASTQLAAWGRIQADSPDYGAHGSAAVRLAMLSFPHRDTPARRAYRSYLTELPAPLVYPEREATPAGAGILADLAQPQVRQQRQQRLQDNLDVISAYQHQRTPPPVRTTPRTTGLAPSRYSPPPTINRNQNRDRGYGR